MVKNAAEGRLQDLHLRMLVMLDESAYKSWASGAALATLPRVSPARIHVHQVGKAVGKVGNDGPALMLPMSK